MASEYGDRVERYRGENSCDWCNGTALHRGQIYRDSFIYAYACANHRQQLEAFMAERPTRRRFK